MWVCVCVMSCPTGYLGCDGGRRDVGGAVLVVVVVVVVHVSAPSPPVLLLLLILLLTLGATLHGVRVAERVGVRVGQQGGRGWQLLQGGVRGFDSDHGLPQQVDGVGQSGQDELETLLEKEKKKKRQ